MKPLPSIQRRLVWLCIHPAEESATNRQQVAYIIFAVVIFAGKLFIFVTSLAFCWKFISIDSERCMLAFMPMAAAFGSAYIMTNTIIRLREKTATVFKDLMIIYENSKCLWKCFTSNNYQNELYESNILLNDSDETESSFRFLAQANKICEWLGTIYFKYTIFLGIIIIITGLASVLYCWLTSNNLMGDNLFHPLPIMEVIFQLHN